MGGPAGTANIVPNVDAKLKMRLVLHGTRFSKFSQQERLQSREAFEIHVILPSCQASKMGFLLLRGRIDVTHS
jgi:hypothetical protein